MKIEAGKYYKRATGEIFGPAVFDPKSPRYPWDLKPLSSDNMADFESFTGDGQYGAFGSSEHDLVAEVPFDELHTQAPTIKHGRLLEIDPVNHPTHYTKHPSGVECITITEHMNFNLGNAVKYIWRAGEKGSALEDLKKAAWYLAREIKRLENAPTPA